MVGEDLLALGVACAVLMVLYLLTGGCERAANLGRVVRSEADLWWLDGPLSLSLASAVAVLLSFTPAGDSLLARVAAVGLAMPLAALFAVRALRRRAMHPYLLFSGGVLAAGAISPAAALVTSFALVLLVQGYESELSLLCSQMRDPGEVQVAARMSLEFLSAALDVQAIAIAMAALRAVAPGSPIVDFVGFAAAVVVVLSLFVPGLLPLRAAPFAPPGVRRIQAGLARRTLANATRAD